MDEIGLFPLGVVLLPSEVMPLHIFEPRYRELIGECLEEDRTFGLVYSSDDGLSEIGTEAEVTEVLERFDDGRLNVVVEGRNRFRLLDLTDGRSFQTAEVEPYDDVEDPADPPDIEGALALFRRIVELTGSEIAEPSQVTGALSFAVASRFEFPPDLKQELLAERSERLRLARLVDVLEGIVETVQHQREIAVRAQGNGKVQPRG